MELINTIELSPYDYANSEYEYPNENSKDLLEKRDEFWRKCLADKNLENLRAIKKGSYLVDISSIGNKELEGIIKNKLKEIDLADYEEQVGRICGGIVIKIENEFPVEPTCCGDIGNIQEWEKIFQEETESWRQLWIGHPWIFYRKANDKIEFSDYSDANIEDLQEVKSVIEIQTNELKVKLKAIREQQVEFENRIRITLEKMGIQNSKRIAKLLTGNE